MKESMIEKEELLTMLTEMTAQLEALDCGLQQASLNLRESCQGEQTIKLSFCGDRLTTLEARLKYFNDGDQQVKSFKPKKSMKLELGF